MLGSLLGPLVFLAAAGPPAELTDQTYAQWREFVRPKKDELCFETVQWLPTFWDAVVASHKQDKPILLWAMNGHPLACT